MIAELGSFFIIIAFFTSLLQSAYLVPILRAYTGASLLPACWLQGLCVTLAFALLIQLRLDSDFSVRVVSEHSNLALPLLYKVAGAWGNHEGSMLLWVWVLAFFAMLLAFNRNMKDEALRKTAVALQALLGAGFLLFIICTSNPFARQFPPPADGSALNPILQDIALSIHPPLLYLGYVGFSVVFSLAVAALLEGRMTRQWASSAHPWIVLAWSALTVGIGLGSWWAYRVLGWGGFWFWDPVENASLMPWLCGTALLHSNIVLKKRGTLHAWVLLLAIITFTLSLLGTFLVRSGMLTSVHSFASDPARGFFILSYIFCVAGAALYLYAMRSDSAIEGQPHQPLQPASREGLIVINNLFLLAACGTVMLGTLYPMFMEWWNDDRISVGAPYFNITFIPLLALPLLFAGLAPFLPWIRGDAREVLKKVRPQLVAAAAVLLITLAVARPVVLSGAFGLSLAAWLLLASMEWVRRQGIGFASLPVFLAHLGAALVIAGVTGASVWKQEVERGMGVGDSVTLAGYRLIYEKQSFEDSANYRAKKGRFRVTDDSGQLITMLEPEYRLYHIRKTATSTAAIRSTPLHDLYAVIGESSPDGRQTAVRIYYSPLVNLMWLGCVLMAAGGLTSIVRKKVL